jgi:hypothetical protein
MAQMAMAQTFTESRMTVTLPAHGDANWDTTLNAAINGVDTRLTAVESKAITASAIQSNLVPATTNTYSLGTTGNRFSKLYVGTNITYPDGTSQTTAPMALYCGSFEDTTTQTNAGVTSANLVTFNTTSVTNGVSLMSTSQITFANSGRYLVNFLGQFQFSGGASNYNITVWWAKNGTIVPNSASTFTTTSAQASQIMSNVEDIIQVTAGDYYQFYWWAGAAGISLVPTAAATSPTRPLSPSVKLNIFNVG